MLSIQGVSYRYRAAPGPALQDISLNIPAGGVFGLLGPNGAGKTTLISLISGLLTAANGQITFNGQPLAQARAASRNAIALVPQDYAFYPMLSVSENLRFFGGVLGLRGDELKSRIAAAIDFAQLGQVGNKLAEQLSGGLRRRLNLAIGLLGKPELLLLDEPTVGVDPQSRHFLLDAIAALPAAGTTVIYTSHYMEEVEAICPQVAIIDHGQVLAQGSLSTLLQSEATLVELQLDRTLPESLLERYAGVAEGALKYRLQIASTAALPGLLEEIATAGCAIQHLALGQHNLEQLFMRLTRRSLRD